MKRFMIRYRFTDGSREEWHREIERFVAAIEADPALAGKISYRAIRTGDDYYHLATVSDDGAQAALQSSAFFAPYTEKVERTGGGNIEVLPIELIAETDYQP